MWQTELQTEIELSINESVKRSSRSQQTTAQRKLSVSIEPSDGDLVSYRQTIGSSSLEYPERQISGALYSMR